MKKNVLEYLYDAVKKEPDKVAFANETFEMTFMELYLRSQSIGTYLASNGIINKPVVVLMKRHPNEIAAFLGVVAGGNYYVPINEKMPQEKLELILADIKAPVIICDKNTCRQAEEVMHEGKIVLYDDIKNTTPDEELLKRIYEKSIDTDCVYVVYTSGSTGEPKGVCACHRSVIDYIENLSEVMEFDKDTVFGSQTPLYLDACLKEIYPTLKFGAKTYIIPKKLFMTPVKLIEFLNERRINTICWVVSAMTMISAVGTFETVKPKYLKRVAFGSEVFAIKQFNLWKNAAKNAKFVNLYGPTEGTGMCCYYKVEREFAEDEIIPVGRPFNNTDIILLNEENKRAQEGEICIRGASVTLGYYHNFEKTKDVYVQNPLNTNYPEIIYKTGDIGRYNKEGELVFVSRKDNQIKHMGYRIEPGEIEGCINSQKYVEFSKVVYDTETKKIVLFYMGEISKKDLMTNVREKLLDYMYPNKIIRLKKMPLMSNGKADIMLLKKMCSEDCEKNIKDEYVAD